MMPFVRYLFMGLLTAVILAGSAALAHGPSMGWIARDTFHAAMPSADHGEHVSIETGRHEHRETCDPCGAAMAGACMMSLCHPELVTESVGLAPPKAARRYVLDPGQGQSGMTTEVLIPPPKRIL